MRKIIIGLLLTISTCFALTSCKTGVDNSSDTDSATIQETVTITFKQEGKADVVKTVEKGADLTDIPEIAGKTGYTVVWDKTDFTDIQSDMTVTAVYTANTYTIIYDADGFTIDGTTTLLTYDATCSSLDMSLTQEAYRFLGWKYGEVTYTNTSVWNVADNVTLTASWVGKGQVAITFRDTDGSTIIKTVEEGESLTEIPAPKEKKGYTVDTENWYLDEDCTVLATFTNIQDNIEVYAKATAKEYVVTYNASGGLVDEPTQDVVYDSEYTLLTPTHEKAYMQFDGWKDEDGVAVAITGKWTLDSDKELFAQWTDTRPVYTISFVQDGQATKKFSVKEGDDFTDIPAPVPTQKTGYKMVWDRTDFTNVTESITVRATETLKTYTVTLNANGGNVSPKTIYIKYGEKYTLIRPTFGRNEFVAWTYNGKEIDFSGNSWKIDEVDDTIELVAKWIYYTDNF